MKKKNNPLKWSPTLSGWGEFWSSLHLTYKSRMLLSHFLPWIFFFFWGCVYLCVETQYPFSFTFPCTPHCSHLLTSFLSLSPWSPLNSFLPIVRSGEDFTWFSSWSFCGVSTAVWKATPNRWFATTVVYFVHRYTGFASAQPGLPLLDSLWGCLQDRRHWPGRFTQLGLPE